MQRVIRMRFSWSPQSTNDTRVTAAPQHGYRQCRPFLTLASLIIGSKLSMKSSSDVTVVSICGRTRRKHKTTWVGHWLTSTWTVEHTQQQWVPLT